MKTRLLSLLLVCLALAPAGAAPLPPTVQARLPRGVVSLRLFPIALGPGSPRFLVHAWTAPRFYADVQSPSNAPKTLPMAGDVTGNKTAPSPFILDIFSDTPTPTFLTSVVYLSSRTPQKIEARYLNAKTKKGLVFEVTDGFEKLTSHTFFVFDDDLSAGNGYRTTSIQHAWSGGTDDSFTMRNASNGRLELLHIAERYGKNSREILKWNGRDFTAKK